jgi:signal transduction histidine kinase
MPRSRDPVLLVAAALALAVAVSGAASSLRWIGSVFPGFLVLDNRVVASAGLATWPGVAGGEIFQSEIVAVDGRPLESARALAELAARRGEGAPLRYTLRRSGEVRERTVVTRRFLASDFVLLFGSYLFCGLGLAGTALAIRFLGRRDARTTGSALSLWIIGVWALSAVDLYGPHRWFRVHAFFECLLFAGVLHLALVFPHVRPAVRRRPWLPAAFYSAALALGAIGQWTLYQPAAYAKIHRLAVAAFGLSLLALLASQLAAFLRPPSFEARQRVKVLVLGALAALLPQVILSLGSALSGGRAPENAMGWSGVFFPVAVAYAVLREDLFQVDEILRRSLNYAVLTAGVALGYVLAVTAVETVLPASDPTTRWAEVLAFAALSVVVLLPLRDRIQAALDRVFFRSAYDFRRLVEETSRRLSSVTDLDVVAIEVTRAVEDAFHPEWLVFEARRPEEREVGAEALASRAPGVGADDLARARRANAPVDAAQDALVVPFCLEGRLAAVLVLGRRLSGRFYGGYDRQLLKTLANQGALAVENALALVELRALNRNLERKVEERTAELREALVELRDTQGQLVHQEKMASVGRLVAGVAHEMNNPLNFVQGNIHHLREHTRALSAALADYERTLGEAQGAAQQAIPRVRELHDLDFVQGDLGPLFDACGEGVERTLAIVKDLRTFSRLDSGKPSQIDLVEAVESTLTLLANRLREVELVREYGELPGVECLEGQIQQVFMNLLSNALDAVQERGRIVIRLQPAGADAVAVEIEDDGCGIPEEQRDQIFEPFFTTKEVGRGTGLGLAISFGIVARHAGRLSVRSQVGRGSCFRVELPVRFESPEGAPPP